MINVYEQIADNKRRSSLIIVIFITFVCLSGYLLSLLYNSSDVLPIALIISVAHAYISFRFGDQLILKIHHAIPANREDYFDFYTITENLSLSSRIPMPKIWVIQTNSLNAFATGRDPEHASICTTTGLLSALNRTELEGVIAHEISHIKNFDTRLMTLVSVLIGTLSIFIDTITRSTHNRKSGDNHKNSGVLTLIGFILVIFSPLIAQLIQLAISRRREYLADASATMITRQPQGLIDALKKISQSPSLPQASTATASLYIANPFSNNKIANLFSTHPPISERIKALESML